mmetsp:Transcript_1061/g.1649  ORF Transcript_1061/g.1649 Transcript_1061/m.1649 type:complete len:296 (-) Transcript_1061:7-894(-)
MDNSFQQSDINESTPSQEKQEFAQNLGNVWEIFSKLEEELLTARSEIQLKDQRIEQIESLYEMEKEKNAFLSKQIEKLEQSISSSFPTSPPPAQHSRTYNSSSSRDPMESSRRFYGHSTHQPSKSVPLSENIDDTYTEDEDLPSLSDDDFANSDINFNNSSNQQLLDEVEELLAENDDEKDLKYWDDDLFRRIICFRNSDYHDAGTEVSINKKKVKTWYQFIQLLNKKVKPATPIRTVFEVPSHKPIRKLKQVRTGTAYIVCGGELKINENRYPKRIQMFRDTFLSQQKSDKRNH